MKSRRRLYITDYCLTPYENISKSGILCEQGKILAVGGASAFVKEPGLEVIDMRGAYATPGFIDTHIHGAGGFDSSTASEDGADIDMMCKTLASHGVTSFVPTIVSSPIDSMLSSLTALVKALDKEHTGAEPVGIHMEGPFINKQKHGSQKVEDIFDEIDLGLAQELISAGQEKIKIFTFAPELKGSTNFVELLLENNIVPSMGHSVAYEDDVMKVIEAGAVRCTHIFNGMPPLHQREVTLTTVALTDDRITIEIIADGFHLDPRMVDLACRSKPKNKLIGVSDAIQGAGLKDGTYHLGSSEITVEDGLSRTLDGTIAGTTMTLEKGWHHLVTYSHLQNLEAATCFTVNPARDIGLADRGVLRPGKRADISFFDTETNKTRLTVSRGRIVYDSKKQFLDE